jgi:ATP-dependent helicase/nuclease subunit A
MTNLMNPANQKNNGSDGFLPLSTADLSILRDCLEQSALPDQADAVMSAGPLTVVSAGAGTGKTWTLAWRFVWAVLTRTDVNHMLTLTFTDKAASEMRSRIARLLNDAEKMLREAGASENLTGRCRAARESLDQAYISTIHSFSMRVISEAGLSLPVEPFLRVISGPETDEFWSSARAALDTLDADWFSAGMDSCFAAEAKRILADDSTADVLNKWRPDDVADFAARFLDIMDDYGETPDSVMRRAAEPDPGVLDLLKSEIEPQYVRLAEMWENHLQIDLDEYGSSAFVERYRSMCSRWAGADLSDPAAAAKFVPEMAAAVTNARGRLPQDLAGLIGMKLTDWRKQALKLSDFDRVLTDGWCDQEKRLRRTLISIAYLCWRKWEAWKVSRGAVSFGDMVSLAGTALENDRRYASRFCEVLIDEFQDTNRKQDELVKKISRAADPEKFRLFIVGDLKQSIYRFRHADLSLFAGYIHRAREGMGRYIQLTTSFRSSEAVLSAVNMRFSSLWKEGLGEGLNIPYEPLVSPADIQNPPAWIRERQNVTVPVCECIFEQNGLLDSGKEVEENKSDTGRRLAFRLAVRLSQLHGTASIWDADQKAVRPLRWGDIAVLTPSRSSYSALRDAFLSMGVPAVFLASQSFYALPEIRDVCALTAFIANPRDRTSLAGFLSSPFSGLSSPDAQRLIPRISGDDPLGSLKKLAARVPELEKLTAQLEDLARISQIWGPSAAVSALLQRGDLLEQIHPRKRAVAAANLRRAADLLEEYSRSVGNSIAGAAAYLQSALQRGVKEPEAPADTADDAVRVMTIHASKGLEFPVVVVYGLDYKGKDSGRQLVPSLHLAAAAQSYPEQWPQNPPCLLKKVHDRLEQCAETEEAQRLYYVALTRARDGILLCGIVPKNFDPGNGTFMAFESVAGTPAPNPVRTDEAEIRNLRRRNGAPTEGVQTQGCAVQKLTARPQWLKEISATSWSWWNRCPAAWRSLYRQKLPGEWTSGGTAADNSAGGVNFGSTAHWILSRWNFTDEDYLRILSLEDGHLQPEFRSVWRDPAAKADLKSFLERFHSAAGMNLLKRMKAASNAGTLHREMPFKASCGDFDLTGIADVLWTENGPDGKPVRVCIRDYKTTRFSAAVNDSWSLELYRQQLRFYALALKLVHPEYEGLEFDLALWNLRLGTETKVAPLSRDDELAMLDALKKQSRQAVSGPWPASENCAGCPLYQGCLYRGSVR